MLQELFSEDKRDLRSVLLTADFVVVGGGISGICAAVTAARAGVKTVLVQDRPVLGGNASSEVRLWILGATSHMGNNNRWAREGGLMDEILIDNLHRNKEGNPVILDTLLLEKVRNEPNITLLLNTSIYDIKKQSPVEISAIYGFCSQNYTFYEITGKLFCDASGDGIIAYRAGAAYRMGAEDKMEYGEQFAPDKGEYGELLGHSIYFYSKDAGKPVRYTAPSYALQNIKEIPRWSRINAGEHGCKFWWLEYGGRFDTVHDTEAIKWEIWKVVYGVWNYIKNSGNFPEAENMTLEWVGLVPGKRESRRFVGKYTLVQQDIIEQRHHADTVSFGGWAIDLHPAEGVYSTHNGCMQYHSKGIYEIPYRCLVSNDIENLFFAGRCMSASHVAHGSSRVMATSGLGGQAVGMAAAQCLSNGLLPADLLDTDRMHELQQKLNLTGQSIPRIPIDRERNLAANARISVSSEFVLSGFPFDGSWISLDYSAAQLLPLNPDTPYCFEVEADASEETELAVELRYALKPNNYTPDVIAEVVNVKLRRGIQKANITFTKSLIQHQYAFITFLRNEKVCLRTSELRCTGLVSVFNKFNHAVNNYGSQNPPEGSGLDSFEFWCPDRRPAGHNIAMKITPAIKAFGVENIINGYVRPTTMPNAWVASCEEKTSVITFAWDTPQKINRITLFLDTDYDHALESVQMGHPEHVIPFCLREYRLLDENGTIFFEQKENYHTINEIKLDSPLVTSSIRLESERPMSGMPAAIFQIHIA